MPAWTDTIPTDAQDAVDAAFDNTLILSENWLALATGGRPGDLPEGGTYLDGQDPDHVVHFIFADLRGNGAEDLEVGRVHYSRQEMLSDDRAERVIEQLAFQPRAAHPTPAAELVGHAYEYEGDGRYYVVADLGGAVFARRALVSAGADDWLPMFLAVEMWTPDATNPPAAAEKGNAAGRLFSTTNQKLKVRVRVPLGWDGDTDPSFRVTYVLNALETDADVADWRLSYKCLEPNASALANAALETVDVADNIGTSKEEYAVNVADGVTAVLDATKLVRGRELLLVLNRQSVGGAGKVGSALLIGLDILWPVGDRLTE